MNKGINHQILASIITFLISMSVLFYDYNSTQVHQTPVGFIAVEGRDIKRRFKDDLEWTAINDQSELFSEDRIYTGEKTHASLNLTNLKIKLNENTLVKVNQKKEDVVFNLEQGVVTLDLRGNNKNVVLKMGKSELVLTGNDATVNVKRENDKLQIVVDHGSVDVVSSTVTPEVASNTEVTTNANIASSSEVTTNAAVTPSATPKTEVIKKQTLVAGEIFRSDAGKETKSKVCYEYLSPINKEEINQKSVESITFKWKNNCKDQRGKLEVASDEHFDKIIHSSFIHVSESSTVLLDATHTGRLFWRIKSPIEDITYQSFTRFNLDPPTLYGSRVVPGGVEITWEKKEGVKDYTLLIDGVEKTVDGQLGGYFIPNKKIPTEMITNIETPGKIKTPQKAPEIQYKVLAKKDDKSSGWSEVSSIRAVKAREVLPPIFPAVPEELPIELVEGLPVAIEPKREPSNVSLPIALEETVDVTKYKTKKLGITLGLGITSNNYDDGTTSVQQFSLTPKVSWKTPLPFEGGRYRVSANAFFTALPLNSNKIQTDPVNTPSATDTFTIRYLGVNAKVSYLTPWLKNDWRLELSAGWYYNTLFVTNNYFGYSNVTGPQFYPSLERDLKNGSTLGSYIKYSPVSAGAAFLNVSQNFEVATGIYYYLPPVEDQPRWSFSMDYAYMILSSVLQRIYSNGLTLGASLSF